MNNFIKETVSKQKRRYVEGGYNLDLTYISDRVIAMGFPASNVEALYRNRLEDVQQFFEERHKDHYKLYNLCSERSYDHQKFQNRVASYPFDDHNPPEFNMMKPFCEDVDRWLKENERNIAVVHCKAGKGRTGLMICAYLLHCRYYLSAEEVLHYYGTTRTKDEKGVTIPSQRRYVDYYSALVKDNLQYSPVKLYLYSFVIDPLPSLGLGQQEGYIQFEIRQTSIRKYTSEVYQVKRSDSRINIVLPQPLLIVGDVKIEFSQKLDMFGFGKGKGTLVKQSKLFHFWINTFFIDLERSSPLSHYIGPPSPEEIFSLNFAPLCPARSSPLSHESLTARPSLPAASTPAVTSRGADELSHSPVVDTERNCRSQHNSGGSAPGGSGGSSGGEQLPPPRQLRELRNIGSVSKCLDPDDDDEERRSPNGSCISSMQTIHSHPPARTVSIIEPSKQRVDADASCDRGVKLMSISDDTLTDQGAQQTTHSSFNNKRTRHSSVPMTSKTGSTGLNATRFTTRQIPGKLMSVRLKKNQIDKADKDKSNKFSDNFNVTLFLVRPNDQTLQDEFYRPNNVCQHVEESELKDGSSPNSHHRNPQCWEGRESSDEDLSTPPAAFSQGSAGLASTNNHMTVKGPQRSMPLPQQQQLRDRCGEDDVFMDRSPVLLRQHHHQPVAAANSAVALARPALPALSGLPRNSTEPTGTLSRIETWF